MDSIEFHDRRQHQKAMESEGRVADSMDVRRALMERVHSGEISLADAQAELARIKRSASRKGMITRDQAFRGHS